MPRLSYWDIFVAVQFGLFDIYAYDYSQLSISIILFNPLTPRSDWYINLSYNNNTLSRRQVMRITKIIN